MEAEASLQLVSTSTILHTVCSHYTYLIEGNDYDPGPYYVRFPAGAINVSFNVTINNDAIVENNETFQLTISNPLPNNVTLGEINEIVVTIVDDGDLGKYTCCQLNYYG